ncbi:uncharacterized protein BX663DRAFT_57962 [Cokeromyces recurvatus]|uniref:uncharacterized protein n=1 Tax=Cokeromyces recurvatus TaxID=90255 RepID=UPI00221F7962|nr:uncharacterized protein BX663DRAFT_57962 [Cokeromyces recurvatus]KAI7903015.1 hypothetical protein BX663DRAFT_57962 [Cokeromyces recurvatus]
MKCDGKFPCQRCANNKTTCKYNHDKKSTSTTTQQQQKESFPFIPVKKLHKIPFYYYCNSLPPLLLDFFNNLQQQKSSVWTQFFKLYNQEEEREDRIEDINSVLLKEAFRLFVTHNLLYGAFFIQNRQYETTNRMIIYCILALTFYSAYQISLSDQKQDLYLYSIQFYKKAHKLFFEACFPTAVNHAKQIDKIQLIQASILLAHFQCQVFDKEQSFMMIRIGLDLVDYIVEEDKDQCTIKVLDAWYYWLLFYLEKRKTVTIEDEQPMISLPTTLKNPSHIWAFNVIDAYTFFLKSILIKNKHESMNIKSIKNYHQLRIHTIIK